MDIRSKIILAAFVTLALITLGYTYKDIVVDQNYIVRSYISCDPTIESCFEYDEEVYAKIWKNLKGVPLCDQYSEECPDLSCEEGEEGCLVVYCSEDTLEEDEVCAEPPAPVISDAPEPSVDQEALIE